MFRILTIIFGTVLAVVSLAVFYTHQVSNQTLDRYLPSDLDYIVELKPSNFAEKIVKQKWGEQGAQIAYQNGRIAVWNSQTIFCRQDGDVIPPLETADYRGITLYNSLAGQDYWQVPRGGWVFESSQNVLRNLVDFWLSDADSLANNSIWQELKSSSMQGDLSWFMLKNPQTETSFWRGSSLVLNSDNLQFLTLLQRAQVKVFGYGQARERYTGTLLSSAPSDAWLVLGGQNLAEQFAQTEQILAQFAPEILEWLKFNFTTPDLVNGEQMLAWQGNNPLNYQVPTNIAQNDFAESDFHKFATGSERWVALIYPQQNAQISAWLKPWIDFTPRLIFVGQQSFDDRILTSLHFEK